MDWWIFSGFVLDHPIRSLCFHVASLPCASPLALLCHSLVVFLIIIRVDIHRIFTSASAVRNLLFYLVPSLTHLLLLETLWSLIFSLDTPFSLNQTRPIFIFCLSSMGTQFDLHYGGFRGFLVVVFADSFFFCFQTIICSNLE